MDRKLYKGIVGFPTSHDITPTNIDAYLEVLDKFLIAKNEVLIVSKPHFDCIKKICQMGSQYKDKILFRFTIGAMDDNILKFWDTNAPLYKERKKALIYARENGFKTSISMEPLLDASNVVEIATDLVEYVTDYIWIGKMKYTAYFRNKAQKEGDLLMLKHATDIENGQTKKRIKEIYDEFEKKPELFKKIKWKDSYKDVLGIENDNEQKTLPENKISKRKIPNIISVSRRTDIPDCYSNWFFNRLKEGFVKYRKDTKTKPKKVSLKPEDVRCFVFWTKNPGPMLDRLDKLKDYHYYFHFTLTPYGQDIEGAVLPSKDELVKTFIQLSQKKIGEEKVKVIWRYDPILLNDKIDIEYHKREFTKLAESLKDSTDKCVISFIDTRYLSKEIKEQLNLKEITDDLMREIAKEFQPIAEKHGIKIETCAEKIDLTEFGISPAKCIDDRIIGTLIGEELSISKDPSQRKACGCVESIDIGSDNTCKNGCLYCYATKDHKQARLNYHRHNKNSPSLIEEMAEDDKKSLE